MDCCLTIVFQLFWSREVLARVDLVWILWSHFFHSPGHRALCPSSLMRDSGTQWTITFFAEEPGQKTPASFGDPTPAPGRSCSLWTLIGMRTSPGHQSLEWVLSSWEVRSVQLQLLWSKMMEPKSQPSHLNMIHCKCFRNAVMLFAVCNCVFYRQACAITDSDTVVITGGWNTLKKVSRYSVQEWQEDLPNLITGRMNHACTSYLSGGRRVRKYMYMHNVGLYS